MQGLVNLLTQRFHVKDRNGTVERPNQLGNRPRKAASIFLCAQHQELEIPVFPPGRGKVEKIRCLFAEIVVLGVGHDADNFHRRAISFHESESFTKRTFPAEIMPRHLPVDDGRRSGSWSVMIGESRLASSGMPMVSNACDASRGSGGRPSTARFTPRTNPLTGGNDASAVDCTPGKIFCPFKELAVKTADLLGGDKTSHSVGWVVGWKKAVFLTNGRPLLLAAIALTEPIHVPKL